MSKSVSIPMTPNFNMQEVFERTRQMLTAQGYDVSGSVNGATSATMTIYFPDSVSEPEFIIHILNTSDMLRLKGCGVSLVCFCLHSGL